MIRRLAPCSKRRPRDSSIADVLMLNMSQDDNFPVRGVHLVFDAVRW